MRGLALCRSGLEAFLSFMNVLRPWGQLVMRTVRFPVIAFVATLALTFCFAGVRPSSAASTSPNLLAGNASSFDTGQGGWSSMTASASLRRVSTPVQAGTGALSVTTIAQGPVDLYLGSGTGPSSWIQAVPGLRYTGIAYVRAASQYRWIVPSLVFYDASGTKLAGVPGQAGVDAVGSWVPTSRVVGLSPARTAYVVFGLTIYQTATNEVHYIDTASVRSTTAVPRALKAPFHTSGNAIYGADGARVVFRGVHREGTQSAVNLFPTDTEIAQARTWGANVVRVPLNEAMWLGTCPSFVTNNASYPGLVDNEVKQITSRGMLAILDLHNNVTGTCTTAGPQPMADAAYAPKFWSVVAARYKSNPLVAFDLYNEPHDISDAVWLNGGTASYGGKTFRAAGMQQLYNAVRATGATNLVFVSGNAYGARPAATLVSGKNIVNAIHDYPCGPTSLAPCTGTQVYNPTPTLNLWNSIATSKPVMVTEFGFPDRNNGTFIANLISATRTRGWGWAAFSWGDKATSHWWLVASFGSTYEPSPSGIPVLTGLADN